MVYRICNGPVFNKKGVLTGMETKQTNEQTKIFILLTSNVYLLLERYHYVYPLNRSIFLFLLSREKGIKIREKIIHWSN